MFNNSISIMNNIAIVQSQGTSHESPPHITESDLSKFYGTVELRVVDSKPFVSEIELLFGSWIESGEEDVQLEEIYNSRTIPSISVSHE